MDEATSASASSSRSFRVRLIIQKNSSLAAASLSGMPMWRRPSPTAMTNCLLWRPMEIMGNGGERNGKDFRGRTRSRSEGEDEVGYRVLVFAGVVGVEHGLDDEGLQAGGGLAALSHRR